MELKDDLTLHEWRGIAEEDGPEDENGDGYSKATTVMKVPGGLI
jgi:hypothetical protein